MKSSQRTFYILTAYSLAALMTGACARRVERPRRPPATVQTVAAETAELSIVIRTFGSTKDLASVDVIPQVSGLLIATFIRDGSVVTNGQPLFGIDARDYEARVREVEGMTASNRANLDLNRATLARNRTLREKELISAEDFDALQTKVQAAEAQLRTDEASLDLARLNLARCTIAAPIGGICSTRFVDTGNLVTAGQTKLTNIRAYDPMYVDFSVPEQDLPVVRAALAAGPVRLDIAPRGDTNVFPGTLQFIDNAVDSETGTIRLRGQAPNADLKLWAGQFADVSIFAGAVRNAVVVPEGAVQFGKQGAYLFAVSKEQKAELRPVRTGVRHGDRIQILDGVAAGERVVVLGQLMLAPGAEVVEAGTAAAAPSAGSRAASERK